MTQAPRLYTTVEAKLGESLGDLIAARRRNGIAWRRIAIEVTTRTGVDITGETLRTWHVGRAPVTAARP